MNYLLTLILFAFTGFDSEEIKNEATCKVRFEFVNEYNDTFVLTEDDIVFISYLNNKCILEIDSNKAKELEKMAFFNVVKNLKGNWIPGGVDVKFNDSLVDVIGILDCSGSERPPDVYCETCHWHFQLDSNQIIFIINPRSDLYNKYIHIFGTEIYNYFLSAGKIK